MCGSINFLGFFSLQIVIHGCFFGRFSFIAYEIFAYEIDVIFKTLVEDEEVGWFLLEIGDACFYNFLLLSTSYLANATDILLGRIFHDVLV